MSCDKPLNACRDSVFKVSALSLDSDQLLGQPTQTFGVKALDVKAIFGFCDAR